MVNGIWNCAAQCCAGSVPFSMARSIWWEVLPVAIPLLGSAVLGTFSILFNIYCREKNGWVTDTTGWDIISMLMTVPGGWMGNHRLKPGKTESLWLRGASGSGGLPSLVLDGMALPHRDLVNNFGALLDLPLLLKELVACVARTAFTQFHVICQLHHFLDPEAPGLSHQCSGHLFFGLLQYTSQGGLPLNSIRKLQLPKMRQCSLRSL